MLDKISNEELKILKKMMTMANKDRTIILLQPEDIGISSNTLEGRNVFKQRLKELKNQGLIESYIDSKNIAYVQKVIIAEEIYSELIAK